MLLPLYSRILFRPLLVMQPPEGHTLLNPLPAKRLPQLFARSHKKGPRLVALPLLSLALLSHARGQAIPSVKAPAQLSIFGTFTDAKPDFRHWGDEAVYGFSAGGILQSHHVVGLETRGSILRWGQGLEHQEYALVGPRAAVHWGRLSPYLGAFGGYAHAWKYHDMPRSYAPKPKLDKGFGPQWTICGGLDFRLRHHLSIRAGELGFSRIYVTSHSLDQLNASAGIVIHIN